MPYGPIHALSPAAWELAASWEKAGALNPVLRATDVYHGPDETRPDPEQELREAGHVAREGRISDELYDLLPCLSVRASLEYIADFRVEDCKYTALAAAVGSAAAFAVRERDLETGTDVVRAREIGDDELVDALLDLLSLEPGTGTLVGMRVQDALAQKDAVTEQPMSWEHKQIRAVHERPIAGPSIEISIGARDESGNRSSIDSRPLHVVQLDWGHFLNYGLGEGQEEMYWLGPATGENMRKALTALRGALRG